jgi:hypothetical protein
MARPKKNRANPKGGPTPEDIKACIDAQDWVWRERLWQLFLADPNLHIGNNVLSLLAPSWVSISRLEDLAGLGLGAIDPEGLLNREETLKEAAKRLGKKNTNAVKQARHRAKERMASLKHTMPVVTTQGGRVVKVTELP